MFPVVFSKQLKGEKIMNLFKYLILLLLITAVNAYIDAIYLNFINQTDQALLARIDSQIVSTDINISRNESSGIEIKYPRSLASLASIVLIGNGMAWLQITNQNEIYTLHSQGKILCTSATAFPNSLNVTVENPDASHLLNVTCNFQ